MSADVRLVILVLGVALLLCIVSIAVLAALSVNSPQVLDLVASGCVTGLVGILAKSDKSITN